MSISICWFRRDLRLADHRTLTQAAADGPVVALFVDDPAFERSGAVRRSFLRASLASLDSSMGGALVVRRGDPVAVVAALADEVGAGAVYASEDFGPYGRRRDEAVAVRLAADGRELRLVDRPYAVRPGAVTKGDGTPYAVFTPFSRAWQNVGWDAPIGVPEVRWHRCATDGLPAATELDAELPEAGEAAAHALADEFLEGRIAAYDDARNLPGTEGTSRLSPYLRWGTIHPRQLLDRLGDTKAEQVFRSELAWREFYADVLHHRPESAWNNLNRKMDAMVVDRDSSARARFLRWARGETGYPIVDAGMRQLLATGWMHNRVRMITASFLVKDLHLPWQWGARHFLGHLVDGDLASNQHGWQWTAGTGTDAAPYFRIFNPVSQAQKFDPDGVYQRRWVRELEHVADADVAAPWASKRGAALGSLPPMVDHAAERAEALRRYERVSGH